MNTHPTMETISRYLDQALPEEEARRLENHFEECPECRRAVEVLRAAEQLCVPPHTRLEAISRNVMASVRTRPIPERVAGAAAAASSAPKGRLSRLRGLLLGARQSGARPRRRLIFALSAASVVVPAVVIAAVFLNGPLRESMMRSRVTRGPGDVKSLATDIETYTVDANQYVSVRIGPASPPALGQPAPTPIPSPSSRDESITILVTGGYTYDPTNGTTSNGDIWRVKGDEEWIASLTSAGRIGPASPQVAGQPVPTVAYTTGSGIQRYVNLKSANVVDWNNDESYTNDTFHAYLYPADGGTSMGDMWRVKDGESGLGYIHPSHATHLSGGSAHFHPLGPNTESYALIAENPFLRARENPLSTFGIDVDTASYSNMRRFLNHGQMPPRDAVRIEELINYFPYDYPAPDGELPFSIAVEAGQCPWNDAHRLARIGLKGREVPSKDRPACNLVFLLDVSGSMVDENKLPLVKKAMRMLVKNLSKKDRVAIVTYASGTQIALPSTSMYEPEAALAAIDRLHAHGSTNGAAGIQLAYSVAAANFIPAGVNRVILATDGDFNVGITDQSDLVRLIKDKAATGVFLSVFGFGMDNLKDSMLEQLADKGNGNYGYIDTESEARKALVSQLNGTLVPIAKDVKIQVEFNPAEVAAYRLIGYENRALARQDFNNDAKDAGEIGAGHTVTALYEIVPARADDGASLEDDPETRPVVDPLKYQRPREEPEPRRPAANAETSGELLTVKLRYKNPNSDVSKKIEVPVTDPDKGRLDGDVAEASADFRFAASVASFGMLLRDSRYKGNATFQSVAAQAESSLGPDTWGYRREFLSLVEKAAALRDP